MDPIARRTASLRFTVVFAGALACGGPVAAAPPADPVFAAAAAHRGKPVQDEASIEAQLRFIAHELGQVERLEREGLSAEEATAMRAGMAYDQGLLYSRIGDAKRSLAAFERASALKPEDPVWHCDVAIEAWALGRFADAERAFARGLALDPRNEFCLGAQAFGLVSVGRAAEAAAVMARLTAIRPPEAMDAITLVLINAQLDRPLDTGLVDLKTNSLQWGDAMLLHLLGLLPGDQLARQLDEEPDEAQGRACEVLFYLGMLHAGRGDAKSAKLYLKASIATNVPSFRETTGARLALKHLL